MYYMNAYDGCINHVWPKQKAPKKTITLMPSISLLAREIFIFEYGQNEIAKTWLKNKISMKYKYV